MINCGIDLGTCFSSIGTVVDGIPIIIPNMHGSHITPSCIAVSKNEILVGEDALYAFNDPDFVFIEKTKVDLGSNKEYWTPQGNFSPQQVATIIIKHLLAYASQHLGQKIDNVVVTVPAYFDVNQRRLTKLAAEDNNVNVLRILSEPTAASLVSGKIIDGSYILVYDLGGGTFDCSILQMYDGLARVIATRGDTHLGGRDFDECISRSLVTNYDDLTDLEKQQINLLSEKAKRALTTRDFVGVPLVQVNSNLTHQQITYKELKQSTKSLVDRTKECIFECIKDSGLELSDINEIFLVGGSTRMRNIIEMVTHIFKKSPKVLGNPDEAVALGAALHSCELSSQTNKSTLLIDVIPMSLGVGLSDGTCKKLIRKNSPIPTDADEIFTTACDNQESVRVQICQGENELTKNNVVIGELELFNIQKALRGEPQILVTFSIDANAVLSVQAEDINTKSTSQIIITYDLTQNTLKVDETQEVLITKLKTKLESLHVSSENQKQMVQDAILSNNIEFMQSVIEDITES